MVLLFHMTNWDHLVVFNWWLHSYSWCPVEDGWKTQLNGTPFSFYGVSRLLHMSSQQDIETFYMISQCSRKPKGKLPVLSLARPRTDLASFLHISLARRGTSQPRFKYRGDRYQHLVGKMPKNLKPSLISHKHLTKRAGGHLFQFRSSPVLHCLFHTVNFVSGVVVLHFMMPINNGNEVYGMKLRL